MFKFEPYSYPTFAFRLFCSSFIWYASNFPFPVIKLFTIFRIGKGFVSGINAWSMLKSWKYLSKRGK